MIRHSRDKLTATLEQALAAQDRLHGTVRGEAQQANLMYAIQEIRPKSHTELAFVVWAGTKRQPANSMVDEYCRRREGLPSMLFDHPLLSLHGWCMPDTYRMLVFREQLEALAKQLTGNRDGRDVVRGIYQFEKSIKGISPVEFRKLVDPANGLRAEVVTLFYEYIRERYPESLSYVWCSTIIERTHNSEMREIDSCIKSIYISYY